MPSVFNDLVAVDVSKYIEKKNGLSYVSWAFAWQETKKRFPESYYTIYENVNNFPYHTDGSTCWVKTGVTVVWYEQNDQVRGTPADGYVRKELEHIEMLPVMDFKNKSIPLGNITSTDANKAIQRSLTKAIARHGLGLYVYAGEDLPEENFEEQEVKKKKIAEIIPAITELCKDITKDMSDAEKASFVKDNIKAIIGTTTYTKCDDLDKLTRLYNQLKSLQK